MPLIIPNLSAARCLTLTACGEVVTADKELLVWLRKQDPVPFKVAKANTAGGAVYVRIGFGGLSKRHFHLDIATAAYFSGGHAPKINATMGEVRKLVATVNGHKIALDVEGEYALQETELPPLIRSTLIETESHGVSLKMTGGTLAVSGGPIYRISWNLRDGRDPIVSLEALVTETVTQNYLVNAFALMNKAFDVFVKGGRPNARIAN